MVRQSGKTSHFNSHPHKEDDDIGFRLIISSVYFNSHPHKEDDLLYTFLCSLTKYFNSHPHKEDDDNNHTVIKC